MREEETLSVSPSASAGLGQTEPRTLNPRGTIPQSKAAVPKILREADRTVDLALLRAESFTHQTLRHVVAHGGALQAVLYRASAMDASLLSRYAIGFCIGRAEPLLVLKRQ